MNNNIPGWMNQRGLLILSTLASYVPENGSILEVGSFLGRSTTALFNGKKQNVSLDIVDTFLCYPAFLKPNLNNIFESVHLNGSSEMYYIAKDIAIEKGWLDAFKYCVGEDVFNNIKIHQISSKDFNKEKSYNLTFIDASHSCKEVMDDINKFIDDSNLLIGDDFMPQYLGVSQAVTLARDNRTLLVFENTPLWALIPKTGYWRDVFKNNNLLFL
jgi:predicted O-methyltransferase YrrM